MRGIANLHQQLRQLSVSCAQCQDTPPQSVIVFFNLRDPRFNGPLVSEWVIWQNSVGHFFNAVAAGNLVTKATYAIQIQTVRITVDRDMQVRVEPNSGNTVADMVGTRTQIHFNNVMIAAVMSAGSLVTWQKIVHNC